MIANREEARRLVHQTVSDLVGSLLYYDRKEDEELPRGKIEELIEEGRITPDDIMTWFAIELREGLK